MLTRTPGARSFATSLLSKVGGRRTIATAAAAAAATQQQQTALVGRSSPFQQQHQQRQSQLQVQTQHRRFIHIEERMKELGIELPKAAGPRANYDVICHDEDANIMYVSGHLPFQQDGTLMTGRLTGEEGLDVDYGYQAARHAALNIVATLHERLDGDLDQIEKIQKVFGIVQSSKNFQHQHLVMDGASDVLMEIFGKEVGYHARSAIGTSTLPLDITVEVEAIVKLKPQLRFVVGQKVECKVGPSTSDWAEGTITKLRYREPEWEHAAPYQIMLADGRYIFAPEDTEAVIREVKPQNQ